jgi:hypothetical protein
VVKRPEVIAAEIRARLLQQAECLLCDPAPDVAAPVEPVDEIDELVTWQLETGRGR